MWANSACGDIFVNKLNALQQTNEVTSPLSGSTETVWQPLTLSPVLSDMRARWVRSSGVSQSVIYSVSVQYETKWRCSLWENNMACGALMEACSPQVLRLYLTRYDSEFELCLWSWTLTPLRSDGRFTWWVIGVSIATYFFWKRCV